MKIVRSEVDGTMIMVESEGKFYVCDLLRSENRVTCGPYFAKANEAGVRYVAEGLSRAQANYSFNGRLRERGTTEEV